MVLDLLFTNLLHPCKPMLLYASTLLTVVMSRERYCAVRHPIECRNASISGRSGFRTVLGHTALSILVSLVFVIPVFFESEVRQTKTRSILNYNSTHKMEVSTVQNGYMNHFLDQKN